jgi:hypothetical protein
VFINPEIIKSLRKKRMGFQAGEQLEGVCNPEIWGHINALVPSAPSIRKSRKKT